MEWNEDLLTRRNAQTILVGVVTLALVTCIFRSRRFKNLPPGPLALPYIGNMHNLAANEEGGIYKYFAKLGQIYGDVYSIYFGKRLIVILNSFDVIREAIIDQADFFNDRIGINFPNASNAEALSKVLKVNIKPGQTNGVGTASGERAKKIRRMTLTALRDFGVGRKTLDEQCQIEVKYLIDELLKSNGKPLNMKPLLSNAVSNIICSIVFGKRFEYDDSHFKLLLATISDSIQRSGRFSNIKKQIPIISKIFYKKNVKPFEDKFIYEFIKLNVDEHRSTFDPNDIRDYMDLFIKVQSENPEDVVFSEASMYENIYQLFVAGTDTTANTLRWMLVYLIRNPVVQEKCYAELKKEIGLGRLASYEDKENCNYMMATIHETQRLANLVPMGVPHCVTADTTLRGYNIPAKTEVKLNLYNIHMNPKVWPEPEKFKPERWLNKDGKFEKKTDFLPFSLGRRMCLGEQLAKMELFLFSSNLIQTFKFEARDPNVLPSLEADFGIFLTPKDYELRAIHRE